MDEPDLSSTSGWEAKDILGSPLMLVLVSMLWGFTNPVLKLTSEGLEDIKESGRIRQFFAEVKFLVDLSLTSPICGSLTFVFTHVCGVLLGEPIGDKRLTYSGVVCVMAGVSLCMLDKKLS
ncbi:Transmembrane protein 234 [Amphibalanus amphitrite]|uniref:Transmembrane protein 234 n=1 Tax=Amphibalanus amphitrite TaxID=1232801 RepID=A0A6A4WT09_AMPAM|nr:Transmembrane protein 234 [Amphibalanus amphitrite]KAF0305271.1 Transmembrane protein 234 [Amphibalanus amphitrite]